MLPHVSGSPSKPVSASAIIIVALAFALVMLLVILLASTPSSVRGFSLCFCLSCHFDSGILGGMLLPALHQCNPDCLQHYQSFHWLLASFALPGCALPGILQFLASFALPGYVLPGILQLLASFTLLGHVLPGILQLLASFTLPGYVLPGILQLLASFALPGYSSIYSSCRGSLIFSPKMSSSSSCSSVSYAGGHEA